MSKNTGSFFGPYIVKLIIGLALMVGGMYVSTEVEIDFIHKLEEQGIPLDLGKTVAVIGVLMIVFPLVKTFYLQPLQDSISTRTKDLEDTFGQAQSLRSEMERTKAEYEQRLKETEDSARQQIQAEVKKAQEIRAQIQAEANAKADEMLKKAQEEIAAERERALVDMRVHVATLSLQATERILGENMDNERNRRLIDEFIDQVEVPRA